MAGNSVRVTYLCGFLWTTAGTEDVCNEFSAEDTDGELTDELVPLSTESDLSAFILGVCTVFTIGIGSVVAISGAEVELMIL